MRSVRVRTIGTITRQMISFTKNADRTPVVKMTAGSRCLEPNREIEEERDRIEGAGQPEITDDQHHREKQNDGREIHGANGFSAIDDAERHHEHCADDRRSGTIDLRARKFAKREYHIAGQENGHARGNARFGHLMSIQHLHAEDVECIGHSFEHRSTHARIALSPKKKRRAAWHASRRIRL